MTMVVYNIGDFVDIISQPVHLAAPTPSYWYFVRVHPMTEKRSSEMLDRRGVTCYAPTFEHQVKVHRRWQQWTLPKMKRIRSPIFPGIIFVPDFDADMTRLKDFSRDVVGLLRFGEFPMRLSPVLFHAVQQLEKTMGLPVNKANRPFQLGDKLRVKDGVGNPFEMWTGRFERLDGKGRLRVLLQAAEREIAVVLAADQVERV